MFQELTKGSAFCYDKERQYLVSNTGYILTGPNLKYLTVCLNSKVIEFCFRRFYSTSMGKTGMRWLYQYIINLPIPVALTKIDFNDIEHSLALMLNLTQEEITYINSH